jgi:hypothetical protein
MRVLSQFGELRMGQDRSPRSGSHLIIPSSSRVVPIGDDSRESFRVFVTVRGSV